MSICLFRQIGKSERYLTGLRNTLVLCMMLGLGFVIGFVPIVEDNSPIQVNKKNKKLVLIQALHFSISL